MRLLLSLALRLLLVADAAVAPSDGGTSVSSAAAPDAGRDAGHRAPSYPVVRAAAPTVGPLYSPEQFRRVVLRNFAELLRCEALGRRSGASFSGRMVVRFVLQSDGSVVVATVAESTVAPPEVGPCVTQAFRSWRFPSLAGGGILTINYPLVFPLQRSTSR